MLPRKSFLYRFIGLTIVFAVFGVAVFLPLLAGAEDNRLPFIIALSIYGGVYVITVVVNEIIVFRRKKKMKGKAEE